MRPRWLPLLCPWWLPLLCPWWLPLLCPWWLPLLCPWWLPLFTVEIAPGRTRSNLRILAVAGSRPDPGSFSFFQILRAVIPDALPAVGRSIAAGGVTGSTLRPRPVGALAFGLLVEGLLGNSEGIDRSGHPAIEDHLGNYFRDFLLGHADVQCAGNVPLDHLRTVAQHHQRSNGAQAAGSQVYRWAVVDFPVNHRIYKPHHVRRKLGHCGRGLRIVLRPVIKHPEFGSSLLEVYCIFLFVVLQIVFVVLQIVVAGF